MATSDYRVAVFLIRSSRHRPLPQWISTAQAGRVKAEPQPADMALKHSGQISAIAGRLH